MEPDRASGHIRPPSNNVFGAEPNPLLLRPLIGVLKQTRKIYAGDCRAISGINGWQGKPKYSEKTCPRCRVVSAADPRRPIITVF
jgi:hypothetical protein